MVLARIHRDTLSGFCVDVSGVAPGAASDGHLLLAWRDTDGRKRKLRGPLRLDASDTKQLLQDLEAWCPTASIDPRTALEQLGVSPLGRGKAVLKLSIAAIVLAALLAAIVLGAMAG